MRKILFLLLLLAAAAQAQMAEVLKNQYHNEKELGIVMVTEKEGDWKKAIADPNTRILALQLGPETLKPADAEVLLNWVRSGKSLWFYDARLGPLFGFKPYLLKKQQFPNKEEEGDYGGHKKVQGLATVGLALKQHEVTTGVGQVSMFMIPLHDGYWGTMYVEGDTFPLLQINLESPALAAMRWDGRGVVVFKPLCWPEVLSGDRFQANLLDWCAGFQIPGPAGSDKIGDPPGPKHAYITGKPAVSVGTPPDPVAAATPGATPAPTPVAPRTGKDTLVGKDGTLTGNVMTESFRFETGNSSVTVKREDVKSLVIGGTLDLDQMVTWDGTTRRGMLMTTKIDFEVDKDVRTYPKRDIQRLDLAPTK